MKETSCWGVHRRIWKPPLFASSSASEGGGGQGGFVVFVAVSVLPEFFTESLTEPDCFCLTLINPG